MNIDNMNIEVPIRPTDLEILSKSAGSLETSQLNEAVDKNGQNLREYGISECADAAKQIFTPEVINNWSQLSPEQRTELAKTYGDKVAESFHLINYKGVVFEPMEDGLHGYNNGDGHAYISTTLLDAMNSPIQVIDTITHELRHQYQSECIDGHHAISEDTRVEWIKGTLMYTNQSPWAYDPWGYKYNPLETDARYAGESVVREMTKDFINGNYA